MQHSLSFDHRSRPETLRTARATASFCPTSTASFLAGRDAGIEQVPLQHQLPTFGAHHPKSAKKFLQGLVATNKCLSQCNKSRTGPGEALPAVF